MDFNECIAANLKAFRSNKRMSLQEVANLAGLSKAHIWEIEQGRGNPTISTLEGLAAALGVTVFRMLKP
jgi:transcriptional regulator with XRE-family HTH domain